MGGANVALIASGKTVKYFSAVRANLPPGVDGWGMSLRGMMSLVVVFGFGICAIYWAINKFVVPQNVELQATKKKKKAKMSVGDSLKFLIGKRYVRDLATLVVAYGICINLVEVTWKSKLKAQFPNPNDYSAFMIIGFGSLAASTPYLGVILLLFIVMWINAARSLDGQFSALTKSQIADDAQDKGIATEDVDVKSSLDGDGFIEGEVKDKNE